MNINYFFPVFANDNIKDYLKNFKSSTFFKSHENFNFIFVCDQNDKTNLATLKTEVKKNKGSKLITLNKPFIYNDAFYYAIQYFNGDVVLLGDTKVARIDLVFEKCMQKYNKNINVVHIVKKQTKFKGFIFNILNSVYNFFIKIFTNKLDRLNVISLGLIDKNIIDILKTLPTKCCFLKNTKSLLGFETRTIYIPPKTLTYKLNFKKKTWSLISCIVGTVLTLCLITTLILLNCFIKQNVLVYNIIGVVLIAFSLSTTIITLPKHFFDIRNYENRDSEFEVKEVV